MEISRLLADEVILSELGARIAQHRLDLQLTQAELAERAGIAKRTLERIEAGASAQMVSLIRLLRVLELLPGLELLVPAPEARPMELLRHKGKRRQRARGRTGDAAADQGGWTWGDET